ncbi:MAG: EamA family transporter [Gammaproteobacteria bacterium]|nr:EamA family transporter [Gammaproteobacteria bacterium]
MRPGLAWLLASVCCSSLGHLSLKLAARALGQPAGLWGLMGAATRCPWLLIGISLHVLALALWVMGLRQVELSVAYPFIALGLVLVTLLSWRVLGEPLVATHWVGMGLITVGVLVVAAR